MRERFDHIVVGGGSSGSTAAAGLVKRGAKVLLLEAGHSHRHPLLDMPPGIFKMIHGSKYMRYHTTVPQAHLGGRRHEIPQANVLGGGSSVNAQVYMRGRPSDYDAWDETLSGENDNPGWGWKDVLPHFRGMEGNNRLHDDLHGADGPLLVSDPGYIDDLSRWFVQSGAGARRAVQPRFQRAVAARRRLLPVHEPARPALAARPTLSSRRWRTNPNLVDPPACAGAPHRHRERPRGRRRLSRRERAGPHGLRRRRSDRRLGLAVDAATADAIGHRAGGASAGARDRAASSICPASAPI